MPEILYLVTTEYESTFAVYMTKYNRVQYKSPIQNSAWENKNLKCSLKQVGMDRGLGELWVPVENTRESSIAYVEQVPF